MAKRIDPLFDERFLDKHAGSIIGDSAVAIVELVANAWDAFASRVDIVWPDVKTGQAFSITDNGKGLTPEMFERRWRKLDYNRIAEEGDETAPPPELKDARARKVYGRNGRGRHAAFRFSDPYRVRTWREGLEATYEVRRGASHAFELMPISRRDGVEGHGTEISAVSVTSARMDAAEAREIIGTRFLADPGFVVTIDGTEVTFDDVPSMHLKETSVPVPPFGIAELIYLDAIKADRTTQQHGIAWRVNNRLVGTQGWTGFDQERFLDGRKSEAKRFQVIVIADYLAPAVEPDWKSFAPDNAAWQATRAAVHQNVSEYLATFTAGRRREAKEAVRENLQGTVSQLSPAGRDKWDGFVDQVIDSCPTISTDEVQQVASILANLELSNSKYGLVRRLHGMPPGDLDQLHQILVDWNVRTAKLALDEVMSRLKLIEELDRKLRDENSDEVRDLQPLFDRSLWVFGPEFESLEFTSNRGMTEVIRKLWGADIKGSRNRPDYVMLPDGSVGFYSRDAYDENHEVNGVARLVVAEIKRPGIPIESAQKDQAAKYVRELMAKKLVTRATQVTCFVLGSELDDIEGEDRTEGNIMIRPMAYNVFIKRAEARMLGLRNRLRDAPFLKEQGVDGEAFVKSQGQGSLSL
jgi:hypothetical protein